MARPLQLPLAFADAPPEDPPETEPQPVAPALPAELTMLLENGRQLDHELAVRAHRWNSYVPEQRGREIQAAFERHLIGTYEALVPLAVLRSSPA